MFKKLFIVLLVLIIPNTVAANEITKHKIELNFYYRDSVELGKGKVEKRETHVVVIEGYSGSVPEMDTSIGKRTEIVLMGFKVEVVPLTSSLVVHFRDTDTSKKLLTLNFQLTNKLVNQIKGHGFTGLQYIYHPESGAELQFWARVIDGGV
ncbi:MAG: hypothetical protein O7D86_01935 [Proteobacteria bacterium]|nr:hypothetical protein [Pseudomonadota bacterium]